MPSRADADGGESELLSAFAHVDSMDAVLTLMVENPSFYRRSHMLTAWMHAPAVS
jgi:hypothetical protein